MTLNIEIKNLTLMCLIYIREKSFFLYDFWDILKNSKKVLPIKDRFYNTLTNLSTTDKIYEHVLNVQEAFKINTMKGCHNLYPKHLCYTT